MTKSLPFDVLYKQKVVKVTTLPLLPGTTTVIRATKHSGGHGLLSHLLIEALKTNSDKVFVCINNKDSKPIIQAFLTKYGTDIDPFMTPESEWGKGLLTLVGANNLYFQSCTDTVSTSGLIGNSDRNTQSAIDNPDFYFLVGVDSGILKDLQTANPKAVFVVHELNDEDKGPSVEFSVYNHG